MFRKITLRARGAKWEGRGRRGSVPGPVSAPCARSAARPLNNAEPATSDEMAARRETESGEGFMSVEEEKFVAGKQASGERGPSLLRHCNARRRCKILIFGQKI